MKRGKEQTVMAAPLEQTPANQQRLQQARRAWEEMLREGLRRGFFGTCTLEITVQDGTIQGLRRRIEQMEK
jgi:hypothetical protein